MILTGSEIIKQVKSKKIIIDPFDIQNVTTNSYDFHLGDKVGVYDNEVLDMRKKNPMTLLEIPRDGMILEPNKLYLGHTMEVIGSNFFVPIIRGKSSTGRIGLFVHITADLIDIGSINQYTLMMNATQPVRIYPGMPVGQVTFWQVKGKIKELYNGKYNGLSGPQPSQVYRDFES